MTARHSLLRASLDLARLEGRGARWARRTRSVVGEAVSLGRSVVGRSVLVGEGV